VWRFGMIDKDVQMEIIGIVGILSGLALYMGQYDLAQVGIAGLIGFLGGQTLTKKFQQEKNDNKETKDRVRNA
jgi:hypothetical protein